MIIQVGNKQMVASYYTAALEQFLTIIISLNYFLPLVASLTSKPLVIHHGDDTPTQYTSHVATQH